MPSNTVFDMRAEDMVVTSNESTLQLAKFLVPTLPSWASSDRPPKPTSTISSLPTHLQEVRFIGWADQLPLWVIWVDMMMKDHSPMWKTVGIHDAIRNSILDIPKNMSLLLWFAEKWSPKTNTFVLPWGEITITLEDMMVLGGFTVLGGPATSHVESPEDYAALNELKKAHKNIVRSPAKKATFSAWMKEFMSTENAYEHEAFLALWLSKYIFGSVKDTISPETFHLAILLARGRRIAMAPAVLAILYRDLHTLQNAILYLQKEDTKMIMQAVFSPMYYVQVWIWERFPCLRPNGACISSHDETRLARWAEADDASYSGTLEFNTSKEHFVWRPYGTDTNHFLAQRIYNAIDLVRIIDNEEVESYARCLRACKLVGLDTIQDYSPHRVSRQFGFDQDIPADIAHVEDNEDAWVGYSTPLLTQYVYIPSIAFIGNVTDRYAKWWNKEPVSPSDPRVSLPPRRRHGNRMAD